MRSVLGLFLCVFNIGDFDDALLRLENSLHVTKSIRFHSSKLSTTEVQWIETVFGGITGAEIEM